MYEGHGSPEGVLRAHRSRTYIDLDSGETYYKASKYSLKTGWINDGEGASGSGVPRVLAFPFTFDTPNLLTGATVYTPTVGDILLDAWVEIDTAWDGTTPHCDASQFAVGDAGYGWWGLIWGSGVQLDLVDDLGSISASMLSGSTTNLSSLADQNIIQGVGGSFSRRVPAKFTTADPIKVCVSQDGTNTGDDPGSAQGAAVLYLVVVTPVAA